MHRFLSALLAIGFAFPALAQAGMPSNDAHYTILQSARSLGEAQFSTAPVTGGQELRSSGGMQLNHFTYSFRSTATVDADFNLVHDTLSGSVQGVKASAKNVVFTTAADPTGREFKITVETDGKQTGNTLDRHRDLVLLPDLDPAALTLMVHVAIKQPQSAWVLLPKESGILAPAQYTLAGDLRGTLGGQPVAVRHAIVAIGGANAVVVELFFSPDGGLLEGDFNAQNLQVIRDGFKLENRPAPVAPPAGQAPPAGAQQPPTGDPY